MSLTTEQAQDAHSLGAVGRFAEHLVSERDERICGQDDGIGMGARDGKPFAERIPACRFAQSEVGGGNFLHLRRDDLELETGVGQQSAPARRRRGEDEGAAEGRWSWIVGCRWACSRLLLSAKIGHFHFGIVGWHGEIGVGQGGEADGFDRARDLGLVGIFYLGA